MTTVWSLGQPSVSVFPAHTSTVLRAGLITGGLVTGGVYGDVAGLVLVVDDVDTVVVVEVVAEVVVEVAEEVVEEIVEEVVEEVVVAVVVVVDIIVVVVVVVVSTGLGVVTKQETGLSMSSK